MAVKLAGVFLRPTDELLDYLAAIDTLLLVDACAGKGYLQARMKMRHPEVNMVSLDKFPHDITFDDVLPLDATQFEYPEGSVAILTRPCHGGLIEAVEKQAYTCGAYVLYVGLKKNSEIDIDPAWDVNPALDNAGKDGEYAIWIGDKPAMAEIGKKKTFVLVKDPEYDDSVWWYEKRGKKRINPAGGYCYFKDREEILETVEASSWADLDYYKTSLGRRTGVDNGWLSPTGEWFACNYEEHEGLAELIIGMYSDELDRTGWVKVQSSVAYCRYDGKDYTPEQKLWIDRNLTSEDEED